MNNYFIKNGKVFRRKHFCTKSLRMKYEKELKLQLIKGYEYVYIDRKLTSVEKLKHILKHEN